jgi:hypothetical protein
MKLATTARFLATGLALLILVVDVAAKDPIFVKWLVVDDPGDETIRHYWEQAEAGALGAGELVDLGTMLFYRGWSDDAVTYFRQALKLDPELADAWFRIGLVEHHAGDLSAARSAYEKCLGIRSGHAWANFYLALLEEKTGDAAEAMKHFEKAFEHAPELADPAVNPEILSSELQLGAQVRHFDRQRSQQLMPMPFLEPATVHKVRSQFEPTPIPTPTPTPAPTLSAKKVKTPAPPRNPGRAGAGSAATGTTATGAGAASRSGATGSAGTTPGLPDPGSTPYGFPTPPPGEGGAGAIGEGNVAPRIGDTSPETRLAPLWRGLHVLADALV